MVLLRFVSALNKQRPGGLIIRAIAFHARQSARVGSR
jgi:hypothetical protein